MATVETDKKTILIIDDDPVITTVLERRLNHAGYNVIAATSGQDGLAMADKEKPDLIVLDVMIGDLTGYEVCASIKSLNPDLPVIMLTSMIKTIDEHLGYACKADAYIRKPHSGDRLLPEIEKQLERI